MISIGVSTIQIKIDQGISEFTDLKNSFLPIIEPLCSSDPSFPSFNNSFNNIINNIFDTYDLISCDNLTPSIQNAFDKELCGDIFNGVFMTWVSQIVTTFLMFIALIVTFYIIPYFNQDIYDIVPIDAIEIQSSTPASAPVSFYPMTDENTKSL